VVDSYFLIWSSSLRRPTTPSLFPYTTLFRSQILCRLNGDIRSCFPVVGKMTSVNACAPGKLVRCPVRVGLRQLRNGFGAAGQDVLDRFYGGLHGCLVSVSL